MKRTLIEAFLAVALVGAAVFGWTNWKGNASAQAKVSELQVAAEEAGKKAKEAEESIQSSKDAVAAEREEMAAIQVKSQQLDAVKASLASGTVLSDLEASYKTQKSLSADRQLGLGALRMLTKGSSDPAAVEAFQKALEISEWGSRKNTICAAQIALAATGQKTEVMAGCLAGKEGAKGEHAASAHAAPETHAPADAHAAPAASAAPADAHAAAPAAAKSDGHKPSDPHAAPHWTYAGAQGPDRWGMDFPTCGKGQSQAPIDIVGPFVKGKMTVTADYKAGPLKVLNNGHTIQVNVPGGSKLRVDGVAYELIQFHFHRPSEERIDGKPMDMVAHFVHKNAAGNLVVLSLLLREGNENPGIKLLWSYAPPQEGPEVEPADVSFNPGNLLPREFDYYSYEGSLTTPPCTEGVRFVVLKSPVNISREQVNAFPFRANARPVQPRNGRLISVG